MRFYEKMNPFTTPDMDSLTDVFAAIIDYGDGSTDAGGISGGNGNFTVTADHVYAETGSYPVSIQILNGLTGTSTTTTTTATVADGGLTLTGFRVGNPQSDSHGSFILASLVDQNPDATAADYTVTINWEDGSPISQGDYAVGQGDGRFLIEANHNYVLPPAQAGPWIFPVSITVQDDDGAGAGTTSTIVCGRIVPNAPATMGTWVFTDKDEYATAGDFTISIDWGDGKNRKSGHSEFHCEKTHARSIICVRLRSNMGARSVSVSNSWRRPEMFQPKR